MKTRPPVYYTLDLNTGVCEPYPVSAELFRDFLGGKMLGSRLLYELHPKGTDALSPESILIINTAPANGTGAPSSSRFNMSFKNVMTGGIASSNCGGQFGVMMKKTGIDGLIIRGKAEKPSYIEMTGGKIEIKDASELMGLDAEETQERFDDKWGALVIGPAGENLVRYACAVSGERVAGRCGAGAVMGSKNLKAVIAYGTRDAAVVDQKKLDAYVEKWVKYLRKHPMTGGSLPHYGSAGLVNSANASGVLPTRNFQDGHFDGAYATSGEALAETSLTRNSSCISCPIRCERRVKVKGKDKEVKGPEYETAGLFGANIGNTDLDLINEINYQCDVLGMDTISLAGTIAFAMELKQRGMADFGLEFGKTDNLKDVIDKIARREGIYSELANGSKWLSEKYGGKEFAIHAKGLELASYEPRHSAGMGLGYATANRGGCHLNGGYLALVESVSVLSTDKFTPKGKAELTVMFQNMLEAVSAAGFCLFTAQAVVPGILFKLGPMHFVTRTVSKAFIAVRGILRPIWWLMPALLPINLLPVLPQSTAYMYITGQRMTMGRFMQAGERGYNVERLYNLREGFTSKDDTLPDRLLNTPQQADDPRSVVPLDKMLPMYYRVRGWDENGVPTEKKLKQLGLEELWSD